MNSGPIIRMYRSEQEYQIDAANMARHGYQVIKVYGDAPPPRTKVITAQYDYRPRASAMPGTVAPLPYMPQSRAPFNAPLGSPAPTGTSWINSLFTRMREADTRVLAGVAAALIVVSIVLAAVAAQSLNASRQAQTGGGSPVPKSNPTPASVASPSIQTTATTAPTATSTPSGSALVNGATLGGTQEAFTGKYGQPYFKGPVPWWNYQTPEGPAVTFCFCSPEPGLDGQQRQAIFSVDPLDGTASEATMFLIAQRFIPSDARAVRDVHDPLLGLVHVYQSTDLAATFPGQDFTDSSNHDAPLAAGTFSVACEIPPGPGCNIHLGI